MVVTIKGSNFQRCLAFKEKQSIKKFVEIFLLVDKSEMLLVKRIKKFLFFFLSSRLLASRRKKLINEGCPCRVSRKINWMILRAREENFQDQLCGIQRKLLYSRGCKSDTFVLENVIKYVYHDNVRTNSIGISNSIV